MGACVVFLSLLVPGQTEDELPPQLLDGRPSIPFRAGGEARRIAHQFPGMVHGGDHADVEEISDVVIEFLCEVTDHVLQIEVQGDHVVAGILAEPDAQLVEELRELTVVDVVGSLVPHGPLLVVI
jgi:hypothetical protein